MAQLLKCTLFVSYLALTYQVNKQVKVDINILEPQVDSSSTVKKD